MAVESANRILSHLRVALQGTGSGLTDGQLLAQFGATRDEAAFAALVRRHGPMVFNVCHRVLRHTQDAEDAFQATFVVLARRASSLSPREGIASWLHKVAYHAALETRSMNARKRARECQVNPGADWVDSRPEDHQELIGLLDRELSQLPDKYRLPVVLCELEGRTRREVASQLGLPEGTLSSRLATARKLLARRLAKHNPLFSATALTAALSEQASASVPALLVLSTVRAAAGTVPAVVAALTQGVMKAMFLAKLRTVIWSLVVTVSVATVGFAYHLQGATAQTSGQAAPPGDSPTPGKQPREGGVVQGANTPARDEFEALRLEIEALRRSLNATRERVRVLEEQKVARTITTGKDTFWTFDNGNDGTRTLVVIDETTGKVIRREILTLSKEGADAINLNRTGVLQENPKYPIIARLPGTDDQTLMAAAKLASNQAQFKTAAAKLASDQVQLKVIEAAIQTLKKIRAIKLRRSKSNRRFSYCEVTIQNSRGKEEGGETLKYPASIGFAKESTRSEQPCRAETSPAGLLVFGQASGAYRTITSARNDLTPTRSVSEANPVSTFFPSGFHAGRRAARPSLTRRASRRWKPDA